MSASNEVRILDERQMLKFAARLTLETDRLVRGAHAELRVRMITGIPDAALNPEEAHP